MHNKTGVLLVNLGSPDSTDVKDVRKYLDEFLMDERVIDLPYILRALLVKGIILRTRPKRSARAYAKIWQADGSPLISISRKLKDLIQARVTNPIELGMRYGNPSIESGIDALLTKNDALERIYLIPLYPHYALASFETVVEKVRSVLAAKKANVKLEIHPPFYNEPEYIDALATEIHSHAQNRFDYYLFSYHGIPYRHLRKCDPTGSHCTKTRDCCENPSIAHATCYRHQIKTTTALVAAKLGLQEKQYGIAYQSRLKGDSWLQPYTDEVLAQLPAQGVKKLAVICPAFVSDCLETLEEIAMEGKKTFLENGGQEFLQIPCLNTSEKWVKTLSGYARS